MYSAAVRDRSTEPRTRDIPVFLQWPQLLMEAQSVLCDSAVGACGHTNWPDWWGFGKDTCLFNPTLRALPSNAAMNAYVAAD